MVAMIMVKDNSVKTEKSWGIKQALEEFVWSQPLCCTRTSSLQIAALRLEDIYAPSISDRLEWRNM